MPWKRSHYTHLLQLSSGDGVAYNGFSGAIVKLSAGAFRKAGELIDSIPEGEALPSSVEDESLFKHLVGGRFCC